MSSERAAGLRPGVPGPCPRLAWFLGLLLLVGLSACGSPLQEAPKSGTSTSSADTVVSLTVGDVARASRAPALPAASAVERHSPDSAKASSPAPAPADPPLADARAAAEQGQQEARQQWFAEQRESPDATVRLQALALLVPQPGAAFDPELYAFLGDDDDQVRDRAQALWAQQIAQEEGGLGKQVEW
jgi:hypothetical protein